MLKPVSAIGEKISLPAHADWALSALLPSEDGEVLLEIGFGFGHFNASLSKNNSKRGLKVSRKQCGSRKFAFFCSDWKRSTVKLDAT